MSARKFLTAEWKNLVMLNFEVSPVLLHPFVPRGTELDEWQGKTLVSMVGFLFLHTKVLGVPIPFHRNFEEVNLRFYVRRKGTDGWRRGVVFIKEIVPRLAIASVARICYNENYEAMKMRHQITPDAVQYDWYWQNQWHSLSAQLKDTPQSLQTGTEEEFITEHYWGYAKQRNGGTVEYQVEHPPWSVWRANATAFKCDVAGVYGDQWVEYLQGIPHSAFVAVGSPVTVYQGVKL